eukprot:8124599-Pyramimonas_sp.AAC.1
MRQRLPSASCTSRRPTPKRAAGRGRRRRRRGTLASSSSSSLRERDGYPKRPRGNRAREATAIALRVPDHAPSAQGQLFGGVAWPVS